MKKALLVLSLVAAISSLSTTVLAGQDTGYRAAMTNDVRICNTAYNRALREDTNGRLVSKILDREANTSHETK